MRSAVVSSRRGTVDEKRETELKGARREARGGRHQALEHELGTVPHQATEEEDFAPGVAQEAIGHVHRRVRLVDAPDLMYGTAAQPTGPQGEAMESGRGDVRHPNQDAPSGVATNKADEGCQRGGPARACNGWNSSAAATAAANGPPPMGLHWRCSELS